MPRKFTDEQAAEMLRTTVKEVEGLADELDVDEDDWDVQSIADADELLEEDDGEEGQEETVRVRVTADARRALQRARKLVAKAASARSSADATSSAVKAVELIARHNLLDLVDLDDDEEGSELADAAGELAGHVIDAVKRAVGPGLKRAIKNAGRPDRR